MKLLSRFLILVAVPAASAWSPDQQPPAMPLTSFVLPDGLEITPWAASPMLFNPTNLDIDQKGRIWVTEGVNYRGQAGRQPGGDRIVILEDSDGDGKADKSSTFWQNEELLSPLGIAVFDNVVFVSQPPHLLKLTDVNRDGKFDPSAGDIREVVLTGFNGRNHDHSLHSVTAGPDGKFYFNQGNTGAVFTDKSGKTFRLGSHYYQSGGGEWPVDTKAVSGQKSDDGFVYVGGSTVRMNPDGTRAEIVGYNYRNSYEQTVTSRGFVFQNDNDDPPACRTSHIIEHGNAGYFSNDGTRFWNADRRPGQDTPTAHWRQDDPGSMPAGDVYGGGSPTGIAFYENGALGDKFVGSLLSCEAARNVIFSYQPELDGAGFKMKRHDFLTTNPEKNFDGADFTGGVKKESAPELDRLKFNFRPSDVCVGVDGALYVTDWTDPRVGGHDTQDVAASGIVYRIAPKGFKPSLPNIDLDTIDGAVSALRSPAVNVRFLGYQKLKNAGASAYEAVAKVLDDSNPFVASRAIWLLPYLGEPGKSKLDAIIAGDDAANKLTAFRAIRRTDGLIDALPYARKLASDASPAVRVEAAQEMRNRRFDEARDVLVAVAEGYDGKDRSYLESFGIGAGHHAEALWVAIGKKMQPGTPLEWSDTFARLTWRLKPEAAVLPLKTRASANSLGEKQRKLAVDSLAFIPSKASAEALMDLAKEGSAVREQALWWLNNRSEGEWASFNLKPELEKRGLIEKPVELVEIVVPLKPASTKFTVDEVMALKGDAARGKSMAGRCIMCHKIDEAGPDYGPALKGFASRQPPEIVARSIVDPSFDISHGYEGTAINLKDGKWIDGHIIADGDPVVTQSTGGVVQKVPKAQIASRKDMDRSLMLNADQLGMTAQDVADIVEWLKTY
ncbi:MAG: PVC-type heme-binding CxxCH protein [Verrucomicrobiota bacterium]